MVAIKGNGPSYKVEGVYVGKPAFTEIMLLNPSDIKSITSRYKIGTFSSGQNEMPYHNFIKEDNSLVFVTSSNSHRLRVSKADFEKYGNFFNLDDFGMEGWLAAGEKVPMVDEVPDYFTYLSNKLEGSKEVIRGFMQGIAPLRIYFPNPKDTPVELYTRPNIDKIVDSDEEIHFAVPINLTGYFLQKAENWRQVLNESMFDLRELHRGEINPEIEAWFSDFLPKKSHKNPNKVIGYGVWMTPKYQFIAANLPLLDGYAYLMAGGIFDHYIEADMLNSGLKGSGAQRRLRDYIVFHELRHLFKKGYKSIFGRWKIESDSGKYQAEFYRERAKLHEGKELAEIYKILEKVSSSYAKGWRFWKALKRGLLGYGKGRNDRESLESKLEAEAAAFGLKGDAVATYVNMMMVEYEAGEAAEEGAKQQKSERKGSLESKVEALSRNSKSKGKGSKEKDARGKTAIYDKMQVYEAKEAEESKKETDHGEDSKGENSETSKGDAEGAEGDSSQSSSE